MSDNRIDIMSPIWFYDDRSKIDTVYKLKQLIWAADDYALCEIEIDSSLVRGQGTFLDEFEPIEPFLFKIEGGEVLNKDYDSWCATNDISWITSNKE